MIENKAIQLDEKMAPFLTPMPSDNEQLIRTAVEFSLELSTQQIAVLDKLNNLSIDLEHLSKVSSDPEVIYHCATESEKLQNKIRDYKQGKRFHKAKEFVGDLIHSISWYAFAAAREMEGKVAKNQIS